MTAVSSPELREVLARPDVRRRLVAAVSRRVPADATEDVVQAVLCDALVAREVPSIETVPRWLFAIARHKVADFHRRAHRSRETDEDVELAVSDPIEERDLLEHAKAIAPDPRAFEWIVRAEEGATLAEIAKEEDLPAPVVRQRVSRLRRALRTALLTAAALAIAMLVAASHDRAHHEFGRIGADPVAAAGFEGSWRVVAVDCALGAPPACATAIGTRVRIEGNTMTIGTLKLDVADTLREYRAHVETTDATIHVESDLGSVTLARD
jgi:DNA-directed RNA polymerase specialized sigma24 family protein